MNSNKLKITVIILACLIALLIGFPLVAEYVDAGTYKVCQKLNGHLIVLDKPGWSYTGLISNSTTYDMAGIYQFSDNDEDEGGHSIGVIFRDGTKGHINGNVQYKLPTDNEQRLVLHTIYGRSNKQVVNNLIIKSTSEVVKATSPFFKGEGAYSYDKANFIKMVEDQLEKGLFTQVKETIKSKDELGKDTTEVLVYAKKDKDGNEVISKESKFDKFGVQLLSLNIEDIILDDKAMEFIEKRKQVALEALVAQQSMETAKQAAETAKAKAREMVEVQRGKEEVEKMRAVTAAEKEKEVARLYAEQKLATSQLNRQAAEEDAKALIIKKDAEAKANAKLVQAGLTPLEKATIEKETAIGIARELSKMNVPKIIVTSGDKGVNPLDMIGVNQALEIQKKINN